MASRETRKKQRKITAIVVAILLIVLFLWVEQALITRWGDSEGGFSDWVEETFGTLLEYPPEQGAMATSLKHPIASVHVLDVGQGESVLIITPEGTVLIDGGETVEGTKVVEYLRRQGVERIDLLVATHPHSDHIGGLAEVVRQFEVGQVLFPEIPDEMIPTSRAFENLLKAIDQKEGYITIAEPGAVYDFGQEVILHILGPLGKAENTNNLSIVAKLECGTVSFLFTGDAERASESRLVKAYGNDLRADVLVLGHHGSNTSSSASFLNGVKPRIAVISCGVDNSYGHPHREVLERLAERGITIYRTDLEGAVVLETDGTELAVITEQEGENAVA